MSVVVCDDYFLMEYSFIRSMMLFSIRKCFLFLFMGETKAKVNNDAKQALKANKIIISGPQSLKEIAQDSFATSKKCRILYDSRSYVYLIGLFLLLLFSKNIFLEQKGVPSNKEIPQFLSHTNIFWRESISNIQLARGPLLVIVRAHGKTMFCFVQ